MSKSPLVQMDVAKEVRVSRLVNEYGPADREEFLQTMGKIVTKLGGQHFNAAKEKLSQGDMAATIEILLTYYDKAYLNSIEKRKSRILFSSQWDGREPAGFAKELANLKVAYPQAV
jgi:tRNA 2-selenouridine synthase